MEGRDEGEKIVYHEPFAGGAAVFFELYKRKLLARAHLNDVNAVLMNALSVIKTDPGRLISELTYHAKNHQTDAEKHYYMVRAIAPAMGDRVTRAARFMYLNRVCFNGLYRVNSKGVFNVPMGRYVNPTICDAENIMAAHEALQLAEITTDSFATAMRRAKSGEVCYLDPPYLPTKRANKKLDVSSTSFTAYDKSGFGMTDHENLATAFTTAVQKGVHAVLSNSDMPEIRTLYKAHRVDTVKAARTVNSKGDGRGEVSELLVTGVAGAR